MLLWSEKPVPTAPANWLHGSFVRVTVTTIAGGVVIGPQTFALCRVFAVAANNSLVPTRVSDALRFKLCARAAQFNRWA
jgi:hypothetical protein